MTRRIVNIDELTFVPRAKSWAAPADAKRPFDARMAEVALEIGAQKLGYNVTEVPPGMTAFPFHNHRVNEEMFFVLSGSGEIRIGEETHPLRAGDVVACPPGDRSTAHQITNTGDTDLRYLAVSTMIYPEICEYPDSDKFNIAERPRDPDGRVVGFRHVGRAADRVDYWEGE